LEALLWLNLDGGGHDSVDDRAQNRVARFVSALGVSDAAFFDEESEYGFLGEGNVFADKCQILAG
jgi:hypothetical protein